MSIHQILTGLKSQKILVLGDLMLDEYIQGGARRISPEAPVPVVDVKSVFQVPGGAANAAANITSIGGRALLTGRVGKDNDAKIFKQLLNKTINMC